MSERSGSLIQLAIFLTGKFAINRETGVLTVVGDLDHEVRTQYRIHVQAREDLGVPVSTPDTVRMCSIVAHVIWGGIMDPKCVVLKVDSLGQK